MEQENLKHKTKVGLYWSFFNQFANNGLQFVVGIVMARLLSPEDYGITALPAVFIEEAYNEHVLSLYKGKAKFLMSGLDGAKAAILCGWNIDRCGIQQRISEKDRVDRKRFIDFILL